MTEISFKGVLRSTTVMFLSVGLVGIQICGCETQGQTDQEQKVERLIKELQDQDVRAHAAWALGSIGLVDAVPALTQALQDEDQHVRRGAVKALWYLQVEQNYGQNAQSHWNAKANQCKANQALQHFSLSVYLFCFCHIALFRS